MNQQDRSTILVIEELLQEIQESPRTSNSHELNGLIAKIRHVIDDRNQLTLKSISELFGMRFFVDNYQRGYKWDEEQVRDLLNDIDSFDKNKQGFYCLQPVVVRYHVSSDSEEKNYWELIDGQQRITTIFMVLTYLEQKPYDIDYRTRKSSSEFLNDYLPSTLNYSTWADFIRSGNNHSLDNVDNYHFFIAYKTIRDWFESTKNKKKDREQWLGVLLKDVKVIWYVAKLEEKKEESHNSSIDIFMRLNSGKIPLTNAELIKALLLHNAAGHIDDEVFRLKQNEIAQEWDEIERALQKDEFWYFLNGHSPVEPIATRIEYFFNIISNSKAKKQRKSSDEFHAFRYYYKQLNDKADKDSVVKELWKELKQCYYRFFEFYENDELYHLTGYILERGIKNPVELWAESVNKKRSGFISGFKAIIAEHLKKTLWDEEEEASSLSSVQYGNSSDNNKVRDILMLSNIYMHERNQTRMPFHHYAITRWSIEHIHAQKSKQLDEKQKWEVWPAEQSQLIENIPVEHERKKLEGLLEEFCNHKDKSSDVAKSAYKAYLTGLQEVVGSFEEESKDHLTNLALLSRDDNSSLGNSIFSQKRSQILKLDYTKSFVPIATKAIFSKYFSSSVTQMYKWTQEDRDGYEKHLLDCLSKYGLDFKKEES